MLCCSICCSASSNKIAPTTNSIENHSVQGQHYLKHHQAVSEYHPLGIYKWQRRSSAVHIPERGQRVSHCTPILSAMFEFGPAPASCASLPGFLPAQPVSDSLSLAPDWASGVRRCCTKGNLRHREVNCLVQDHRTTVWLTGSWYSGLVSGLSL